jgi:RecT family
MTDEPSTIEERISARTNLAVAGSTAVSSSVGGLAFKDMGQVMEFSKLMAVSGQAVPKHLRAQPGACLAVSLQSLNWRMDPFAVANKSYMVNDRIAYEAQLIHAVIEQRAPIRGRIKGKISGEGATRKWTLTVALKDEDEPLVFEGVESGKIAVKNSPLWKADPDQQLWYYTVRAMARRHFPDVIMGVYEKEELEAEAPPRDITPTEESALQRKVREAREAAAQPAQPEPTVAEPEILDAEVVTPHWTLTHDTSNAFPGSEAWDHGINAAKDGISVQECPYGPDLDAAADWIAGHNGYTRSQE